MVQHDGSSNIRSSTTTTTTTTTIRRVVTVKSNNNDKNELVQLQQVARALFQRRLLHVRILCLEVCLLLFLCTVTVFCHVTLQLHDQYLHPYLETLKWTPERAATEETYPRLECDISDLTTDNPADLFVNASASSVSSSLAEQAIEKALLHGATVLPDIIAPDVASNLRSYILRRNEKLTAAESIHVIMSEHRSSFALSALEDATVTAALQQIGHSETLRSTLSALTGTPNPALVELQVLTAQAGADHQYWHADTSPAGSAMRYQHSFHPLYTVLIPLQDTTPEMGPTAVCPGSHRCYYTRACSGFGPGFGDTVDTSTGSNTDASTNVSTASTATATTSTNTTTTAGFAVTDPATGFAYFQAGHALIYNSVLQHRGSAYTAAQGPDRVALILSFTSPPDNDNDNHNHNTNGNRLPPLDTVYGIRWDHLGYTLDDFRDPATTMQFWKLQWTGLFMARQHGHGHGRLPPAAWNSFRLDTFRTANDGQYRFRKEDLQDQVEAGTGVMGFLSVLFAVPVQDAAKGYQPVEYHAMRLLRRIRIVATVAVIVVASVYAVAVVSLVQTRSGKMATWVRMIAFIAAAVALGQWYSWQVEQTDWARAIVANRVADVKTGSLNRLQMNQSYIESIATPVAQDILVASVSTAAASRLGAQADVLDYHPGNRRWRRAAAQQACWFFFRYQGLPAAFAHAVVDTVIDMAQTKDHFQFLRRNEFGDWFEMDSADIREATVELLFDLGLSPQKKLFSVFPATPCDHSPGSSLCQTKAHVLSLVDPRKIHKLFEKPGANETLVPRFARIDSLAAAQHYRSQLHPPDGGSTAITAGEFIVGQVIECRPDYGASRKWVRATIVGKLNKFYYDVEYFELNQPIHKGVHREVLRTVKARSSKRASFEKLYRRRAQSRVMSEL
jgi:ectoine hydroxylase-related dioxygenase (phytanoyl-CoA dioxygenase family)